MSNNSGELPELDARWRRPMTALEFMTRSENLRREGKSVEDDAELAAEIDRAGRELAAEREKREAEMEAANARAKAEREARTAETRQQLEASARAAFLAAGGEESDFPRMWEGGLRDRVLADHVAAQVAKRGGALWTDEEEREIAARFGVRPL